MNLRACENVPRFHLRDCNEANWKEKTKEQNYEHETEEQFNINFISFEIKIKWKEFFSTVKRKKKLKNQFFMSNCLRSAQVSVVIRFMKKIKSLWHQLISSQKSNNIHLTAFRRRCSLPKNEKFHHLQGAREEASCLLF